MPNLNRTDLFHALFDSFRKYTDATLYLGGNNPYAFTLNEKAVTLFIANVHSARRSNSDEYRIQCPGALPQELSNAYSLGNIVAVLGYFSDEDVFCAWEPERFMNRNTSTRQFSIYTRLSSIHRARTIGFARYTDTDQQVILMFRSEFLGLYIENSSSLHQSTGGTLERIANTYGPTRIGERPDRVIRVRRKRIVTNSVRYTRSPQFRSDVLTAYSNSCAMCGIQLELVEAAHIVPHAHPEGLDVVTNGLALCTLHHRSFDTALVYVGEGYSIYLNRDRADYLRKIGRIGGLRRYGRALRSNLILPKDVACHPSIENLVLGNQLRGIDNI